MGGGGHGRHPVEDDDRRDVDELDDVEEPVGHLGFAVGVAAVEVVDVDDGHVVVLEIVGDGPR